MDVCVVSRISDGSGLCPRVLSPESVREKDRLQAQVHFRDSAETEYVVVELTYKIWDMRWPTAIEEFVDHLMNRLPTKRAILSDWQDGSWIEFERFEQQKKTAFSEQMEKRVGWHNVVYN